MSKVGQYAKHYPQNYGGVVILRRKIAEVTPHGLSEICCVSWQICRRIAGEVGGLGAIKIIHGVNRIYSRGSKSLWQRGYCRIERDHWIGEPQAEGAQSKELSLTYLLFANSVEQ
jgi:hypothetical protein